MNSLIGFLVVVLAFAGSPGPLWGAEKQAARIKILIDPAHGGGDSGVTIGKTREKDLVLDLALKIKARLADSPRLEIHLTRSDDRNLAVPQRVDLARGMNPDLFMSLHVNAGFGKAAGGYELFFPGFKSASGSGGEPAAIIADMSRNKHQNDTVRFSQGLLKNLERVLPRKGRGLREAPILILNDLPFPAVLVELGFGTSPEDKKLLLKEKTTRDIVDALVKSLQEYVP